MYLYVTYNQTDILYGFAFNFPLWSTYKKFHLIITCDYFEGSNNFLLFNLVCGREWGKENMNGIVCSCACDGKSLFHPKKAFELWCKL